MTNVRFPPMIAVWRPVGIGPIADDGPASHTSPMTKIDATVLGQLPLADVIKVTFYKRDEITTDLICCDVNLRGAISTFHEELAGWDLLVQHLERLEGFKADWFASVSQPAFALCPTVAFSRTD